jgi:hypothetical protein
MTHLLPRAYFQDAPRTPTPLDANVSALIHNVGMAITMDDYGLTWTDGNGTNHAAVSHYDKKSADNRKAELEAAGCTAVEVVPVKVGQVLQPKS